jgi:DNA polymerase-3 subunit delta'
MRGLGSILGQPQAVAVLQRALRTDRLAHAYLFEGPAGVGKATTARILMQAFVCESLPGEGCGACAPCEKVSTGAHPDYIRVGLQDERKDILIAQIRDVVRACAFRPHEAPRRLVLVDPADRMNISAANALLKTLEEPPEDTHFVLCTAASSRLPITIRSRCQHVRFAPLSTGLIAQELERVHGIGSEPARFTASLSEGSLGRAVDLCQGGLTLRRAHAERLQAAAASGSPEEIFLASSELSRDKEELFETLGLLRIFYRDALVTCEGLCAVAPLVNADRPEAVQAAAVHATGAGMRRRLRAVAEAEGALQANVNPQLLLDRLMLRLRECDP